MTYRSPSSVVGTFVRDDDGHGTQLWCGHCGTPPRAIASKVFNAIMADAVGRHCSGCYYVYTTEGWRKPTGLELMKHATNA